jgi:hypothetical protein
VGDVSSSFETTRKVSNYVQKSVEALRPLAETHHNKVLSAQTKMAATARTMLKEAYLTGCVLLALREKDAPFLSADRKTINGTDISRSAGYRYMELAEGWHLLQGAEVYHVAGALDHIKAQKALESLSDLEDQGEWTKEGETVEQKPRRKGAGGRPQSTLTSKLPGRISKLSADIRQGYHDDPRAALVGVTNAIRELELVRDEIQDYIEEG